MRMGEPVDVNGCGARGEPSATIRGKRRAGRYGGQVSTRDQNAVASLQGHAQRCVQLDIPVDEAATSLRQISASAEVLAEAAGILAGAVDPRTADYGHRIAAARLLVAAGADRERLPHWIGVGRYDATRPTGPGGAADWPDDLNWVMADVIGGV